MENDPLPKKLREEVDKRLKAEAEAKKNNNRISLPAIQINNGQQPYSQPQTSTSTQQS